MLGDVGCTYMSCHLCLSWTCTKVVSIVIWLGDDFRRCPVWPLCHRWVWSQGNGSENGLYGFMAMWMEHSEAVDFGWWITGWWFGTFFIFHILGIIIPIDSYFSEGWPNHQPGSCWDALDCGHTSSSPTCWDLELRWGCAKQVLST